MPPASEVATRLEGQRGRCSERGRDAQSCGGRRDPTCCSDRLSNLVVRSEPPQCGGCLLLLLVRAVEYERNERRDAACLGGRHSVEGRRGRCSERAGMLTVSEGGAIPPAIAIATLFSSFTARFCSALAAYSFCIAAPSRTSATSDAIPPASEVATRSGAPRKVQRAEQRRSQL